MSRRILKSNIKISIYFLLPIFYLEIALNLFLADINFLY